MATVDSPGETPPVEDTRVELQEAAATLRELLGAEDERIQIRAAEAILDRAGITKGKRISASSAAKDVGGEPGIFDEPGKNFF